MLENILSSGVLLLELDDSDGEDALLLVLGLVGSLVDHQVFSQTHVRPWQGAEDTVCELVKTTLRDCFHS